ncbi:MAG TPA: isoprenylcysteine carboxylmethyltransferase family protein [Acidobacteriaceae bacterium]|nr:isoprenylcysteine carboxylmethyltransferase family protein [Acidobacteriaceae bacterium]
MKLAQWLFRFRRVALITIFVVAFWAPWERFGGAHPGSTWLWLAGTLEALGFFPIATSTIVVIAMATLALLLAALVRTWATSYLGSDVVFDKDLHAERVVADGPYRYVRNPLYVGTWLLTAALSILMPPGGALFALVTVTLLILAWVFAEERKLTTERGDAYTAYLKKVPRFFPSVVPRVPAGTARPHWLQGFLGEVHLWGMTLTYLIFAHRYNVTILEQGALIAVGITFLVRAVWRPAIPEHA